MKSNRLNNATNEELLQMLKNELIRLQTTSYEAFRKDRNKEVPGVFYYQRRFNTSWNGLLEMVGMKGVFINNKFKFSRNKPNIICPECKNKIDIKLVKWNKDNKSENLFCQMCNIKLNVKRTYKYTTSRDKT
jgi:predicted SprT family Zn-dependent metalloprotease